MSSVYLIRHGQAGTRGHYDALSDLGRRQAYLLGQHLAAQQVPFKAFIAGCLNRQRQTAEEVWRAGAQLQRASRSLRSISRAGIPSRPATVSG